MDEINKIPPVTRTLIGATLGVTLPTLLKLVHPYVYLLWWPAITQKLQVWRVVTCFFLGSGDLQLLFDVFLLYRNASDLEVNTFFRRTSEMVWALLTMATVILATNYPLSSAVLFSPMLSAITYVWSRANPHGRVSIFGVINCPALWLPYAYLALDLLIGGEGRMLQSATGIIAGHTYWLLHHILPASNGGRGLRLLPAAPAWLRRLLPDSVDPAAPPAPQAAQGGSSRTTSYGGVAFAPRGRSFGDTPPAAAPPGGRALGSAPAAGSSSGGLFGWLPSFGGGSGAASGSTSGNRAAAPDREALLRAAEARLQAQRQGSIAGRNSAAARVAAQAASSPSAQARLARSNAEAPSSMAGSPSLQKESNTSALAQKSNTTVRRGAGGVGSFAELAGKEEKKEQQESASGSGGRVAEQRRPDQEVPKSEEVEEKKGEEGGHSWGGGQRLGG